MDFNSSFYINYQICSIRAIIWGRVQIYFTCRFFSEERNKDEKGYINTS